MNNKADVIKVYVGTDPHMKKGEVALEYSIRKHTKSEVEIIWMDYGRGGVWADWNIGREHEKPYSGVGWSTDFSCFRFAIPEVNKFEGRAIYLDVDMLLLKDIKELFDYPMGTSPMLITPRGLDVILFNCAAFKNFDWWPSLEQMKKSDRKVNDYWKLLADHKVIGNLSPFWNCLDGMGFSPEYTGLVHFTDMRTQPWKPYPDVFEYPPHPRPDMVELWQKYYDEAIAAEKKGKS